LLYSSADTFTLMERKHFTFRDYDLGGGKYK